MVYFEETYCCSFCSVQDVVHVGVKLKALKPSIVLPLGKFLASGRHLHLVLITFGKDQHGLIIRDIDHKDKQNFDTVVHITSQSVLALLSKGTATFLEVLKCIVDSYLDKNLDPLSSIEILWYAVLFMRYWRTWLTLHRDFTLANNFITRNAYMCIELNAML